jgi:hypothetical protein
MEKTLIQKQIQKNTLALIGRYRKLEDLLSKLPANPDLTAFLTELRGTLDFYSKNYANVQSIDLQTAKRMNEPILGLNRIEQFFNASEQGFYQLYPDKKFETALKRAFKSTELYYQRLGEWLAKIA